MEFSAANSAFTISISVIMYSLVIPWRFFMIPFLMPEVSGSSGDQCRHLEFRPEQAFKGKRLLNHVMRVHDPMMTDFCDALCYMEHNCASYNLKRRSKPEGHRCELNNSTHEGNENDLEENPHYVYRGTKSACVSSPCKNKATCQTGFTDKGYRCLCTAGFQGPDCQYDIDECASGAHDCGADAACINAEGSYNCSCKPGYSGDVGHCQDVDECSSGTHGCSADAVCNNTEGSYLCSCLPGYSGDGEVCEDIDECAPGTDDCNVNAVCDNTMGSYICTCIPPYYGDGRVCEELQCKELYERNLTNERNPHCGLGSCGEDRWKLVMKIDGSKQTFHYDSHLWSDEQTYNLAGGETVFDTQETKLTTYWDTSFTKICLGMKIPGEENINFLVINQVANSLYSLIADGHYYNTSLSRDTWKTLIGSQASLQMNCNMDGFNARCFWPPNSRARIGFVANNQDDCWTCDSRIGFGAGGNPDNSSTCGNVAENGVDNGNKFINAMCYIFVR